MSTQGKKKCSDCCYSLVAIRSPGAYPLNNYRYLQIIYYL